LAQLAGTLNEAFDNCQRVLERIDRFSLDAAHQLRNPLTAMRASGEVCLQKERSVGEYQEVIGGLVEDSRRLGHTVDQLLLLARLTRKDLAEVFEPLDLSPVVVDLVDSLRPAFEASDVRLELRVETGPYRIQGSPRLIEQAVANLLDNALRFTPAQGVVQVSLEKPGPGRILLSVADSGPGLSPLAAPGGTQGDSRSTTIRSKEGAGLGLLIVSNVVSAHGGTVQAKVSQWGGACFSLDLPASE
jgi:signal transduction histidine kinase